ncbi:MAG: hypothetical protein ACI9VN_002994 [Patescibacteria group bacterium]
MRVYSKKNCMFSNGLFIQHFSINAIVLDVVTSEFL